jgi:hypothetical protein
MRDRGQAPTKRKKITTAESRAIRDAAVAKAEAEAAAKPGDAPLFSSDH